MEVDIERKRSEIVASMKALRRKLEASDDSELLAWVIPGRLACAPAMQRWDRQIGARRRLHLEEARKLCMR